MLENNRRNTLWCSGNTAGSGPAVLGSSPSRVVDLMEFLLIRRIMENENNNQEPGPSGKRCLLNGQGARTNYDQQGDIYGYSPLLDGEERLLQGAAV